MLVELDDELPNIDGRTEVKRNDAVDRGNVGYEDDENVVKVEHEDLYQL